MFIKFLRFIEHLFFSIEQLSVLIINTLGTKYWSRRMSLGHYKLYWFNREVTDVFDTLGSVVENSS